MVAAAITCLRIWDEPGRCCMVQYKARKTNEQRASPHAKTITYLIFPKKTQKDLTIKFLEDIRGVREKL